VKPSEYRDLLIKALSELDMATINRMSELFIDAYMNDSTIFIFGNGGSGATASHATGDFLKGASYGLEKRFKVVCLNDNLPSLMAIANDIGWEEIFREPLKNFLKPKDLVIAISGSGNSVNVIKAAQFAQLKGATVIGMTGFSGGKLKQIANLAIHSAEMDMEVAEDIHMAVFNMVKKACIDKLHGKSKSMGAIYDSRIN